MSELSMANVDMRLAVNVNGAKFGCAGRATGATGLGTLAASIEADTDLPAGFDISLLTYVIVTGLPAMGLTVGRAMNPFAGKYDFRAERVLDLGDRGSLRTTWGATQSPTGDWTEEFEVEGQVDCPKLVSLEPTIETWTPDRPGFFDGQFALVWRGADGEVVRGRTTSRYSLPDGYDLPHQMFRDIRFEIRSDQRRLWQTEHIVMFGADQFEDQYAAKAPSIDNALALSH
jgi:hypothetical protein